MVHHQRFTLNHPDGVIAGWHFPGKDSMGTTKPRLLFCHATGFCASAYRQVFEKISTHIDIYAIDMRGHGKTTLPNDPQNLKSWAIYVQDIHYVLDHLNNTTDCNRPWILAGHSMGAVTTTMAAVTSNDLTHDIAGLILLEPVGVPPLFNWLAKTPAWSLIKTSTPMVRTAASRRDHWQTREAVLSGYQRKAFFKSWAPGVLKDYLLDGLISEENGYRLACNPAWEAATFGAQANAFWPTVKKCGPKCHVLTGDLKQSTVRKDGEKRFYRYGAEFYRNSNLSHLFPLENPEVAAKFIIDCII